MNDAVPLLRCGYAVVRVFGDVAKIALVLYTL